MSQMDQIQTSKFDAAEANEIARRSSHFAIALIAVGALLRTLSFFYSANSGGDAWARLSLTAEWLQHPVFKVAYGAYPPGHFWLIGLVTLVFHDLVFAGRFLSLITGIGSLFFLWRLARNLSGEPAGVIALSVF